MSVFVNWTARRHFNTFVSITIHAIRACYIIPKGVGKRQVKDRREFINQVRVQTVQGDRQA
jgi:hypothetical protein